MFVSQTIRPGLQRPLVVVLEKAVVVAIVGVVDGCSPSSLVPP